jgi:hypothetical protein
MNNVCLNVIKLFSTSFEIISEKEDCIRFIAEYQINNLMLPSEAEVANLINSRDKIAIYFFETDDAESIDYISTQANSWSDFITELQTNNLQQGKIKILVEKKFGNGQLSIYDIDKFTEYINSLSLSQFLAVINESFNTFLIFEVQDKNYLQWETKTIAFIAMNSTYNMSDIGNVNRTNRINEARSLCYCDIEKYKLLPEDLFCFQFDENNLLQKAFHEACMLYVFSFILDYSAIRQDIYEYKLNGFRTLNGFINTKQLSKVDIDINSCKTVYEIYQWLYSGGNNIDKINIARNIISLNINPTTLRVEPSAFESILSNYKIYEKENVKQYLQVRNKLSELLIDLQAKISDIVDSFIGDFKKNMLTLISFFISVIVIRVVSKGDFIGGFTNEIIGLSFVFLIISIGMLLYSRWELTKKIDLYNKHYDQIKDRYKGVLSSIELENIFDECDPEKNNKNESFVAKQKKLYTWIWFLSIFLLIIFLVVVYFKNNDISICCK